MRSARTHRFEVTLVMDKHYSRSVALAAIVSLALCAPALGASRTSRHPARARHAVSQSPARTASHGRIRQAQQALDHTGAKLKVDGMMGPRTRKALRRFQRAHGLKTTGGLGPKTSHLLGIRE